MSGQYGDNWTGAVFAGLAQTGVGLAGMAQGQLSRALELIERQNELLHRQQAIIERLLAERDVACEFETDVGRVTYRFERE